MRYHFTLIRTAIIKNKKRKKKISIGKDVKKLEPLCTLWKMIWQFLKKFNIELPYDPAMLGIYSKEVKAGT